MCIIDTSMLKKTRPITVLTAEELDALDDATFDELTADEERLHQALEDPSTIRSEQALSIAKTKPRRQTVSRQRILDEALAHDSDDPQDQAPPPHQVLALALLRYMTSHWMDDASTQVDEDMAMHPTATQERDWDKESP